MRILQVCDGYPPDGGGLANHVERLTQTLTARGHEVVVAAAGWTTDADRGSSEVRRIRSSFSRLPKVYEADSPPFHPPWPDPAFAKALAHIVREFKPDAVHAHGWCMFSAAAIDSDPRVSVVATLHDHGIACPKKSLLRRGGECPVGRGKACFSCDEQTMPKRVGLAAALAATSPRLFRRVKMFLAVSSYVAVRTAEVGAPAAKLEVVPNFIDVGADVAPAPEDNRADAQYLLYAGPPDPHKGRAVLVEAMGRASSSLELVMAGGDGSVSGPGVRDLGHQSGEQLSRLYAGAVAVAVPSIWHDPCPTVALEAMAHGTPVIASAVGGLPEILDDGRSGLLVPPGDAQALGAAIDRIVADAGLRSQIGENGRARVTKQFSTQAVLPRIEAAYSPSEVT